MKTMSNIPRDKKFFEHGEWAELLAEKDLMDHPKEVFSRFVRESIEDGYRREYYWALEWTDSEGPDWEDLTEEQRENIRKKSREQAQAMAAFGKEIASGDADKVKAAGVEENTADKQAFITASAPIYDAFAAKVEGGGDLLARAQALAK